jgi:hypothetical protein
MLDRLDQLQEKLGASMRYEAKSSVLGPLQWMIGIVGTLTVGSKYVDLDDVYTIVGAALTVVGVVLFLGLYMYCFCYDRDALRSDKYGLSKMAIERGMLGDSKQGLQEAPKEVPATLVGSKPPALEDKRE